MRHKRASKRFGRDSSHLKATLASMVCNLVEHKRIRTTVAKAKAARRLAEAMVTVARKGTLAARRQAIAALRQESCVTRLFDEIVPRLAGRQGGYTRVVREARRSGDGAEVAFLEWVDIAPRVRRKPKKTEAKDEKKS